LSLEFECSTDGNETRAALSSGTSLGGAALPCCEKSPEAKTMKIMISLPHQATQSLSTKGLLEHETYNIATQSRLSFF
jgi:hypothetical protein